MNTIEDKSNTTDKPEVYVYLSQGLILGEDIEGTTIIVSITNTSESVRYFKEPSLRSSVPFEGITDFPLNIERVLSIKKTDKNDNEVSVHFPVILGCKEKVTAEYKLLPNDIEVFRGLLSQDGNATITAVVRTTEKQEKFESKPYNVAELVKDANYVRDDTDVFDQLGN